MSGLVLCQWGKLTSGSSLRGAWSEACWQFGLRWLVRNNLLFHLSGASAGSLLLSCSSRPADRTNTEHEVRHLTRSFQGFRVTAAAEKVGQHFITSLFLVFKCRYKAHEVSADGLIVHSSSLTGLQGAAARPVKTGGFELEYLNKHLLVNFEACPSCCTVTDLNAGCGF